jgi:hypothetical protein
MSPEMVDLVQTVKQLNENDRKMLYCRDIEAAAPSPFLRFQ